MAEMEEDEEPFAAAAAPASMKTALDALRAKHSAMAIAGYDPLSFSPVPSPYDDDHDETDENDDGDDGGEYVRMLRCVAVRLLLGDVAAKENRQSPLVNAGYAVRVASVLAGVRAFASYHRRCRRRRRRRRHSGGSNNNKSDLSDADDDDADRPIQVVVLGAGYDVTGLWFMSLLGADDDELGGSITTNVVEVDLPRVCRVKKEALDRLRGEIGLEEVEVEQAEPSLSNAVPSSSSSSTSSRAATGGGDGTGVVFRGRRRPRNGTAGSAASSSASRYALLAGDLRDNDLDSAVRRGLSELLRPGVPTLFVSELVLTYLGREACDGLLSWCADRVAVSESCLLAYEPLGPSPSSSSSDRSSGGTGTCLSVLEGYRLSYYEQFVAKLERGRTAKDPTTTTTATAAHNGNRSIASDFDPLGFSCASVEQRLLRRGFGRSDVVLAGNVAAYLAKKKKTAGRTSSCLFRTTELFDEHAALALHLQSYCVVHAFGSETNSIFRLSMCPWIDKSGCSPPRLRYLSSDDPRHFPVWLTRIERRDEQKIRSLFSSAYQHLLRDHPSIRKMVKTALRKDLFAAAAAAQPQTADDDDKRRGESDDDDDSSSIREHYTANGGFFLVAVVLKDEQQGGDEDSLIIEPSKAREAIGGIGLRRLSWKEAVDRGLGNDAPCFEIHRLVVGEASRRCGVGRALLKRAEEILGDNIAPAKSFRLLATSPTLLEGANLFYESAGFHVLDENDIENLTMKTYCRTVML